MAQSNDNDDIKWLYGKLKAKGYNIGSEAEFKSSLANAEDRKWYYQKAKGMGLNMGSMADFDGMYAPKAASTPQKQKPTTPTRPTNVTTSTPQSGVTPAPSTTSVKQEKKDQPLTEADRQRMMANVGNMMAETNASIQRTQNRMDYARANAGLRVPRVTIGDKNSGVRLGQNSKVVAKKPHLNPKSGKMEQTYITESGNEYTDRGAADLEQNSIDEEARKLLGLDMNDQQIDAEQKPANAAVAALWKEAEAKYAADRNKNAEDVYGGNPWMHGGREMHIVDAATNSHKNEVSRLTRFDLQKMMDNAWGRVGKQMTASCYAQLKRQYPTATEQQLQNSASVMARRLSDNAVYKYAVAKNTPKSTLEFFAKTAADMNLLRTISKGLARSEAGTTGDMAAYEAAMGEYGKSHRWAQVGGTVTGMLFDPTTYISGGVGSFAGKTALNLGGRIVARKAATNVGARLFGNTLTGRVVAGVAGGAGNLGTYEGIKEGESQFLHGGHINPETGENEGYSAGDVVKSTLHGTLLGSVTGTVSPLLGNVADKWVKATSNTAGKVGIRAGELATSTVAEGTIFSIPEWINGNGDAMDVWSDNMAMMLGFKGQHMIKSAPRVIAGLRPIENPRTMQERNQNRMSFGELLRKQLDASPRDMAFTKEEREELQKYGYGDLAALFTRTPKRKPSKPQRKPQSTDGKVMYLDIPEADVEDLGKKAREQWLKQHPGFDGYETMERLMQDPNVSQSARAKAYYILTGHQLPMGTVTGYTTETDEHGNIFVKSMTANGEVVTNKRFTDEASAKREQDKIMRQAELNSVDVGEQYTEAKADNKVWEAAIEAVAPGADPETVKRNYQAAKEGDKDAIANYGQMVDAIDKFMEENKGMADTERPEAIRAAIKEETGVDVDKAIKKEPSSRTEPEKAAVQDYIERLFPEQAKETEQPMSDDEAGASAIYDQSRLLWEKVEQGDADAKADVDAIVLRMKEAYDICNEAFGTDAEMRMAEMEENPWALANDPNLTEDQQNAVLNYINAKAAMDGVQDASNDAMENKRREVAANVERHTHKDNGMVQPATMKVDDKPIYIVKGNVVPLSDGTGIDVRNSDQSIVICDAETGEYKFTSPDQIYNIGEAIDPQTELDEAYANIQAEHDAVLGSTGNGENVPNSEESVQKTPEGVEYGVNDTFTLLDGEGATIHGEVQGISDDGVEIRTDEPLNGKHVQVIPVEEFEENVESINDADGNPVWTREYADDADATEDTSGSPAPQDNDVVTPTAPTTEELVQMARNGDELAQRELAAQGVKWEEPTEPQPTALSRVPINEETQEPMFEKADKETALDALNEVTGGNEENTTAIVNAQLEQAQKAVDALKKKQPTKKAPSLKGSPMAMVKAQQEADAAYNAAMEQYNGQVAQAEETLNAWTRIYALMNERKRAVREQQEAEWRERNARLHDEAVAQVEEQKRIAAEKAAEQAEVGTHAVNPKIKAKWDGATKVEGNPNALTLADGSTLRGHYVLTEAGTATASHDINNAFEPTEGFPIDENGESVNDRDYKRDMDAQQIVRDIANNYDSRALQSPVIVSKDGVVLSGNNRTMSGDMAAQQGTDKAYIDHLREFGQMYGFTPEQVESMKHPRVLFVPDEELPYDAATFARFNAEQQKKQSKPEHAVKLGKIVPDNVFNSIVGDISRFDRLSDYYADSKAVNSAISQLQSAGVINEMQLPELRTGNTLSAAGRELIENTLIGKVFQTSPDAVRQIISTPTLRQSVIMGLNEIAHNRTLTKSGYDLSNELGAAVDLVARAKASDADLFKEGMPVSPFGRQQGLFDDEYGDSRVTDAIVLLLADLLNSGKPSDLRKVLATYNNEAANPAAGQLDMFSGKVTSKEELLNRVIEYFRNATPKEQQAIVDAAVAERKQRAETSKQVGETTERSGEEPADIQGESNGGISEAHVGLNDDEANKLLSRMEGNTSEIPQIELNPTNWIEQFGENGMVKTPLGEVKMGENQIAKLFEKGRSEQFGMIKPTLEHPQVVIEVPSEASDGNTERASSLLFVKTFKGANGKKVYYFKSVTVKKDGLEVSVSSHYDRAKRVKEALKKGKLLYRFDGGAQTERHPADVSVTTSPDITQGNDNMVWKHADDVSDASDVAQGLYSSQGNVSDLATEGTDAPQTSMSNSDSKVINNQSELQEKGEKSSANNGVTPLSEQIATASAEVNTEPTEAQKEAGNYKKGHVQVGTFDITIEQPEGSVRKGTDANGKKWESKMHNTYGYIRGTEGVDGDHIDVFLSNDIDGWNGRKVYVVDQYNPDGTFDEHKVMLGFNDMDEAKSDYLANYEKGWEDGRRIDVSTTNLEDFEKWIGSSHRKTKPFAEYAGVKKETVGNAPAKEEATPTKAETKQTKTSESEGYTITPSTYTNKKGKTSDVSLLTFDHDLTADQERAVKEFAKERTGEGRFAPARGWKDRERGGWVFRNEDDARKAAEMVGSDEAVADNQPLTAQEMRDAVEPKKPTARKKAVAKKPANKVEVADVVEQKPSEPTKTAEPAKEEKPQYEVSDEEMNGLMNDIRDILGIGDDEGDTGLKFRDPDELTAEQRQKLMSVGQRLAMAMVERGNESFGDYASMMVKALGNKVRPWLKAFYGGLEYVPGYDKYALTPYEEVKAFDVENFDKPHKDVLAQADMIVEESKAQVAADKANSELKEIRNEQRKETEKQTAADTDAVAAEAETIAIKAESLTKTSSDEQELNEAAERVDEALDNVNDQLALLGYYEAEQVEKDFNEAYGYMRNAEKKAVKDAANLASQLIDDLGLDRYEATHGEADKKGKRKTKPLAVANIAPAGGNVTMHLPLTEGRELYVNIQLAPSAGKGITNYGGDNLEVTGIMCRVENPNGKGNDRYGQNMWFAEDVTYDELLKNVQRVAYRYIPERTDVAEGEYKVGDKVQYSPDGKTWRDAVVAQPNDMGGIRIDTGQAPVMWVNASPEQLRHKAQVAEPASADNIIDNPQSWVGRTFTYNGMQLVCKEVEGNYATFDNKATFMNMGFEVPTVQGYLKSGKFQVEGEKPVEPQNEDRKIAKSANTATTTLGRYQKAYDDFVDGIENKGMLPDTKALKNKLAQAKRRLTILDKGAALGIKSEDDLHRHEAAMEDAKQMRDAFQAMLEYVEKRMKDAEKGKKRVKPEQQVGDLFGGQLDEVAEKEVAERDGNSEIHRTFAMTVKNDMLSSLDNGTKPYRGILDLRKRAKEIGMDVDDDGRTDILLQELVEDGLVRAAREVVERKGRDSKETYDLICKLYEMQPTISARSSNRIKMQQYSTPLPMAWNAGRFAMSGKENGKVLEPTAGNGMLVFTVPSEQVHVNELDETRLANLREQGFAEVTQQDATEPFEGGKQYDVVIANPPFGKREAVEYDGKMIGGLDPQITLNALASMKDDGRAAIIIGGNMEYAKNGGLKSMKPFFTYLYDHYNVKGVVDMDGKLYAKQGTTFPTRMILIDGRRSEEDRAQSAVYPPVQSKAVRKAESFEDLYNIVEEITNSNEKTNGTEILRSQQGQLIPDTGRGTGRGDGRPRSEEHPSHDGDGRRHGGHDVERDTHGGEHILRGEHREDTGNGTPARGTGGDKQGTSRGAGEPVVRGVDGLGVRGRGVGLTTRQTENNQPKKRTLTEEKLAYRPHNTAFSLESVAPAAMVEAMDNVLSQIEEKEGSIDEFVTRELDYDTIEDAHNALAAEQMDSVAMAIYQMKQGQAMIIGDQTGVGKGRQMAALIRWAVKRGEKPVFITQKADLFSDIYRDLVDIGSGDLVPFIFNSPTGENKGEMVDANGKVVHKGLSNAKMKKVLATGKLPDGYDYAVLTYSQVNTGDAISQEEAKAAAKKNGSRTKKSKSEGKATPKATFLRSIAKDNYLFLDESHTAAGSSNTGAYLQSILRGAKAATFASATFAKRPDTMPLYAIRTAMSEAKVKPEEMIGIIEKGGVTLQEIMSRELTNAGQMVRRERDMSDVKTDWKTIDDAETVKRARENYDRTITAFNAIIKFQEDYVKPLIDDLDQELAVYAESAGIKRGTDKLGVQNVPFASKTYNYTKQLMLALKVDAIVDEVEAEINAGRHPVIALESTMESSIKEYAAGEVIDEPTFSASLLRGLDSVMQYSVKDENGKESHAYYTPEQLGEAGEKAYYDLQKLIRESTSDIFISPLDAIIERLHEKGFKVGELTGRNSYVERDGNGNVVVRRRTDKDKKRMQREFNNGELDVLILNKSASTGISLHASEKFSDQRQRTMIIAQPLSDINDYMQMIGRIDRTGQVHRGYYINLGLPVPAENRFLMMLSTKLKSLNANTTTSQDSESNEVEAPDLLNKYGSQVVVEYLRDNPDIYDKMGSPLKKGGDNGKTPLKASELDDYKPQEDDARKITGCVALLSTKEQEDFYDDVVRRYNELMKYLNDTGNNDLKITVMPLRAKTIDKRVSSEGIDPNGSNPFARNSYVEKVEMDVLRKPMKADEVRKTIEQVNKGQTAEDHLRGIVATIKSEDETRMAAENTRYENALQKAQEDIAKQTEKINGQQKRTAEEKQSAIAAYTSETNERVEAKHGDNVRRIKLNHQLLVSKLNMFEVGKSYLVPDNLETQMFDFAAPAIFCGYKAKDSKITASTTLAVFATLDGRRRVEVKLSQLEALNSIQRMTNDNWDSARSTTLDNWDSQIPTESRKTGYIMTGNILQAIADTQDEHGGYPGQLISYTDIDGNVHDGILMPDKWNSTMLKTSGAPLVSRLQQIKEFMPIVSHDGKVEITGSAWANTYYLTVPKTKKDGAVYFENKTLLKAAGGNFYPYHGKLRADISADNIEKVVKELSKLGVKVKEDIQTDEDKTKFRLLEDEELSRVNDDFNKRLSELVENPNQKDKLLRLGRASQFLKDGGMADAEIVLEFDKLARKSKEGYKHEHPFDMTDIKDLPKAIASPIVVFDNTNGRNDGKVILTELEKEGRNFIVAVQTVRQDRKGGVVLEVNQIVTLFPKDARGIVNWLNLGKATNIDKEKALHFIEALPNHPGTTIKDEELISAANVVRNFENEKVSDGNVVVDKPREASPSLSTLILDGNTREEMTARVNELSERLHTPVRIIRTDEEVAALPSARQRRMKGSFNPMTGEVTIVVPNNANMADVENTFVHEVVGHDGLRVLFPEEEKLNNALDELYRVSNVGIQQTIDRMAQKMYDAEVDRLREKKRREHEAKGEDANASYYADMAEAHAEASKKREQFRRDATEEYGADLAGRIGESGFEKMSAEELTFWGKLKAMLQKALQRLLDGLKIPGKRKWSDKDWAFVLHEAYKRKKNGGNPTVFDAADTEVMRRKTEFGETKFSDGNKKGNEPKPIGRSTFGSVYNQFKGKVLQAVKFLANHKSGDLLGVFHRRDIGDIDMVWGDNGGGLCHILNKHINDKDFPTVKDLVSRIEDIVNNGKVDFSNGDKMVLKKDGYVVTIRRNVREKGIKIADKNWVLTAYNKDAPANTKAPADGTHGSTAVAPGTSSDAKVATLSEINEFSDDNISDNGMKFRDGDSGNTTRQWRGTSMSSV